MNLSFFLCLAACRTRSSACDTLSRSCARRVLCWSAFPLVPVLGSTGSAADRSALFVGFPATTTESDFSGSCIIGYGSSPSRCGPAVSSRRPNPRPPGSRARSFRTCQGLRPRRAGRALAIIAPVHVAFRVSDHVGIRDISSFRGSMAGLCAPLSTLRRHPRGCRRMARGQCGSLHLHCEGLALSTPCRSSRRTKIIIFAQNPSH